MPRLKYTTTEDLKISKKIVDQVIGQEEAVKIIKKASKQRRNVLLIGSPGTGKSLIGQALAELLPKEKLQDILSYANPSDDNVPLIKSMPKGKGKEIITRAKIQSIGGFDKIVPSEGLVFIYKGKTYKLTGIFAPINQLTGLMTF